MNTAHDYPPTAISCDNTVYNTKSCTLRSHHADKVRGMWLERNASQRRGGRNISRFAKYFDDEESLQPVR
jgi:hypothetical protein